MSLSSSSRWPWAPGRGILRRRAASGWRRTAASVRPTEVVGKRRDVAHVNSGADDDPARANRLQRERDQRSDGREQYRGVERFRRGLIAALRGDATETQGERLRGLVPCPRESVEVPTLR